jgi:FkbH-like protein
MKGLKYSEILSRNLELGRALTSDRRYKITVLSNVTVNQLKGILEYALRIKNINAEVSFGNYDNIVQDSANCEEADLIIIFWEPANLIAGGQFNIDLFGLDKTNELLSRVQNEMDIVFRNLKTAPLVLMNSFCPLLFNKSCLRKNNFDSLCSALNEYAEHNKPNNTLLVSIETVIAKISIDKAFNARFFYSSSALYTIDFYKEYAADVLPSMLSVNGFTKKALILDCDNTLWKGIIGEDGPQGISMSAQTADGVIFEEVQTLVLELVSKGVILAICSKNNPQDIDEVLVTHPQMRIRDKDITIKKVNWDDKVSNIKSIAAELNIGLDSIVFVDDSSFEVELVRNNLPQVQALQVPATLSEYPGMIRRNMGLFFNLHSTSEDARRVELYKDEALRQDTRDKFQNMEEYLRSLEIKISLYVDEEKFIPRIAQLTQKTNQFNLTTKRYTESEIKSYIDAKDYSVVAFEVKDKFGDYGTVGVVILKVNQNKHTVAVDSFLMSCRVIGRNIEFAVFNFLIKHLVCSGFVKIETSYIKSTKNEQVKDLYERMGCSVISSDQNESHFKLNITNNNIINVDYIDVSYG